MPIEAVEKEYRATQALYESLCREIVTQINELLFSEHISIASPIEYRVKTRSSIVEKIERNQSNPQKLSEITDVAGLRMIAIFRRDVERICHIVESNLRVLGKEDTSGRLGENQFGYGSVHYQVTPPKEWLQIPTLRKLAGLEAEIQVRTGSQHIWAAASHVLQYKKETHVPIPLRRSINRAAALLETIDLEFERLLVEREQYSREILETRQDLPLNTESLRRVLDRVLPGQNRSENEDYADLLDDLVNLNVTTTDRLRDILGKHVSEAMKSEHAELRRVADSIRKGEEPFGTSPERVKAGVYFTHVGLAREALRKEFGPAIKVGTAKREKRPGE